MLAVLKHVQKPKKNVKTEKSMFTSETIFFYIFTCALHLWKFFEDIQWFDIEYEIYFASEINFIFNVQNIEFSIDYIFYGFWTCFFQILDTVCKTWRDVTIAYFTLCTFDIFTVRK